MKAINDWVLIKRFPEDKVNPGGVIIIPDTLRERPMSGTVISVGRGKVTPKGVIPCTVKEGDQVVFKKYAGTAIKFEDDEDYLIMKEDEILVVL